MGSDGGSGVDLGRPHLHFCCHSLSVLLNTSPNPAHKLLPQSLDTSLLPFLLLPGRDCTSTNSILAHTCVLTRAHTLTLPGGGGMDRQGSVALAGTPGRTADQCSPLSVKRAWCASYPSCSQSWGAGGRAPLPLPPEPHQRIHLLLLPAKCFSETGLDSP